MKDKRAMWKLLGTLTGIVTGMATRTVMKAAWKKLRGGDPPTNPAAPGTSWNEALIWAASSGVAMAITKLVAQRGAAEAWKAETGSYPPGLETVSP